MDAALWIYKVFISNCSYYYIEIENEAARYLQLG